MKQGSNGKMTRKNMKKIALLAYIVLLAQCGFAQSTYPGTPEPATGTHLYDGRPTINLKPVQLSLRFAPGLAFNSAQSEGSASSITHAGPAVRLSGGLSADIFMAETYAFSTGLWYTIKRSAFENMPFPTSSPSTTPNNVSEYNLQYLQVPVSLKLFTNEISPDMRAYFQVGGTLDIKLAEKAKSLGENAVYQRAREQGAKVYKPLDVGILLGAGIELRVTEHNSVFAGLTYNRGVINVLRDGLKDDSGNSYQDQIKSLNSLLSLEVGLKF